MKTKALKAALLLGVFVFALVATLAVVEQNNDTASKNIDKREIKVLPTLG